MMATAYSLRQKLAPDAYDFGLELPMLYSSPSFLARHLKENGLWPLRDGWEIVEVEFKVTSTIDPSTIDMHGE